MRRDGTENPRAGFFVEYLKDPQATEDAWRGGWFHTGDVVRQDETGMLFFIDRYKNIIAAQARTLPRRRSRRRCWDMRPSRRSRSWPSADEVREEK